jgi:hypothetical protein
MLGTIITPEKGPLISLRFLGFYLLQCIDVYIRDIESYRHYRNALNILGEAKKQWSKENPKEFLFVADLGDLIDGKAKKRYFFLALTFLNLYHMIIIIKRIFSLIQIYLCNFAKVSRIYFSTPFSA